MPKVTRTALLFGTTAGSARRRAFSSTDSAAPQYFLLAEFSFIARFNCFPSPFIRGGVLQKSTLYSLGLGMKFTNTSFDLHLPHQRGHGTPAASLCRSGQLPISSKHRSTRATLRFLPPKPMLMCQTHKIFLLKAHVIPKTRCPRVLSVKLLVIRERKPHFKALQSAGTFPEEPYC